MQRRSDLMQENGSKNTSRMVLDLVMGRCGLKRNGEPIELVDSPAQMPLAFHVLAVFCHVKQVPSLSGDHAGTFYVPHR
jgi:hypothetical protein